MSQLYSYSRIGCYFTCPWQYENRYIKKTPSPLPEGVELFMGSRFHEAMEYLYGQLPSSLPSLEDLVQRFDQFWEVGWKNLQVKQKQKGFSSPIRISKEGEAIEDYYQRAKLFVERYYEKYKPFDQDQTVKNGLERRVLFSLDPDGLYRMQGYIDRVAKTPDGTLWVHDYKTGSHKHNPGDSEKEDQLSLYQVGLSQDPLFKDSPIRLMWHYVAFDDDVIEIQRNPDELESLKSRYIQKIQTIEKAKTYEPQTSALCGWCEYLPLCPKGQAAVEQRRKKKDGAGNGSFVMPAELNSSSLLAEGPKTEKTSEPRLGSERATFGNKPHPTPKAKKKLGNEPTPQLPLF
jgi:putative RecB family exonuclease